MLSALSGCAHCQDGPVRGGLHIDRKQEGQALRFWGAPRFSVSGVAAASFTCNAIGVRNLSLRALSAEMLS